MRRLLEDRRRRLVAHARGALDVVRPRGEGVGALGERFGRARVRLQPPRLARRLIDGAAHDRVAERVAPWHRGRPQHVALHQLLERRQRLRLAEPAAAAARSRSAGSPGDRRAPHQPPRGVTEALDLLAERGRHRGRHADRGLVVERLRAPVDTRASSCR